MRRTSMTATIENHCQRERRKRSMRPESRRRLPKVGFSPGFSGERARKHAMAKKPASRSSSKTSLSIRSRSNRECRTIHTGATKPVLYTPPRAPHERMSPQPWAGNSFRVSTDRLGRHHEVPANGSHQRGESSMSYLRVDFLAWNIESQIQTFYREYYRTPASWS